MAEKKAMAKDQGRKAQQKYIFFFYLWPHFARCYAPSFNHLSSSLLSG
jgi:hypothetical protein